MTQHRKNGLTNKEKKFCHTYLSNGGNGSRAAVAAGYVDGPGIATTATRLLKMAHIIEFLQMMRDKDEFKTVVTVEKQLKRLEMISSVTVDMFVTFSKRGTATFKPMDEWTEAMKYAVEGYSYDRKGRLQLKLHGKNWAADMLNKHLGIYEKDNRQQNGVQILLPGMAPQTLSQDNKLPADAESES